MKQVLKLKPLARLVQYACMQIGAEWRAAQAAKAVAKPDSDHVKQ